MSDRRGLRPLFVQSARGKAAGLGRLNNLGGVYVFLLTNLQKDGTIGKSSVRGPSIILAPGKLTISAMVSKHQSYGYNPSVGKN